MMKSKTVAAVAVALGLGFAQPAWAEMPQTDVELLLQLGATDAAKALDALAVYYDLHVSEIVVQVNREQNTSVFLAARRAEEAGDKAEAERQNKLFQNTKAALDDARAANLKLRQELGLMTGLSFDTDLHMAPDAPDELPDAPAGAPADLLAKREAAWIKVEQARKILNEARLTLLDVQDKYNQTRKGPIGEAMGAVTEGELAVAKAIAEYRLVEARIAAALGKPLGEALGGL